MNFHLFIKKRWSSTAEYCYLTTASYLKKHKGTKPFYHLDNSKNFVGNPIKANTSCEGAFILSKFEILPHLPLIITMLASFFLH